MYNLNDTIVAICSGPAAAKKIIRISGDCAFEIISGFIDTSSMPQNRGVVCLPIKITDDLLVEAVLYFFYSPASYTGEDVVEIHISVCEQAVEKLFSDLISAGCRSAGAGEFTYRAYVNGKIDLSQAEAVAQIISSSNRYQLDAAQKLFAGTIEQKVSQLRKDILQLLSLVEAGLDFSTEQIEFITPQKAIASAAEIANRLSALLCGAITFEQITELPSVVVAAAANAGKSSLVNSLTGTSASIVSDQSGTTRDSLGRGLKLKNCDCCIVDCAGIANQPVELIDCLANIAAANAIDDAAVIIFCADITKKNYQRDLQIFNSLKKSPIICAATKCDLVGSEIAEKKLKELENIFGREFFATSSKTFTGLEKLKQNIENRLVSGDSKILETSGQPALTQRHRQLVADAIENIKAAKVEFENDNSEMAAVVLRSAAIGLSSIDNEYIDEEILSSIFSRFCIGK